MDKLNGTLMHSLAALENKGKIKKTAALASSLDIAKPEDLKMTNEMLNLDKYKPIIDGLKQSIGIVNFVTYDEYEPLIAMLIRKAFPLNQNMIFNAGLPIVPSTPSSSGISTPSKGVQPSPPKAEPIYPLESIREKFFLTPDFFSRHSTTTNQDQKARSRLENLLFGTPKKMTSAWLKESGFTEKQMAAILSGKTDDETIQVALAACNAASGQNRSIPLNPNMRGAFVKAYEILFKEIEDKYNGSILALHKEIRQELVKKKEDKRLRPEDLAQKKRNLIRLVEARDLQIEHLNYTFGDNILIDDGYTGSPERNPDGFLNSSYKSNISQLSRQLYESILAHDKEQDVISIAMSLKQALMDFSTDNEELQKSRDSMIAFLGEGTRKDYINMVNNAYGIFTNIREIMQGEIKKQGRVLIIDDFDKTPFCVKNDPDPKSKSYALNSEASKVLNRFVGINQFNLEGDDTPKEKRSWDEKGNKIVVLVSSQKIAHLPASVVVEMDVAPVDKQEAEIIVNNIMGAYIKAAKSSALIRINKEIDEKYTQQYGGLDVESLDPKEKATAIDAHNKKQNALRARKESLQDTTYRISHECRKKMISYIIGLGQASAINAVRMALSSGRIFTAEASFDEDKIISTIKDYTVKKIKDEVVGVTKLEKECTFEKYAYRENTSWANQVGAIKRNVTMIQMLRDKCKANESRIKAIEIMIRRHSSPNANSSEKLSPSALSKLNAEKQSLEQYINDKQKVIEDNASQQMPHLFLLYGDPGVGKTVFGSALADLLNYPLFRINISDQQNMYIGNTGERARRLLNFLKNSQETIFVLDEIDRQLPQAGGAGDINIHPVHKELMDKMLEFFGYRGNDELFVKNKVYFIMTTNHIEGVEGALRSRAKVTAEVLPPQGFQSYRKILGSSVDWYSPSYSDADLQNINWDLVAKSYESFNVSCRFITQMMEHAFSHDRTWRNNMTVFEEGNAGMLGDLQGLGLPLTTENLIDVGPLMSEGYGHGVLELESQRVKKITPILAPYLTGQKKFKTAGDPNNPIATDKLVFPEEATKIMMGKDTTIESRMPVAEEAVGEYEYTREIDPATGKVKADVKKKIDPAQEMENLKDTGFAEEPLITPPEISQGKTLETKENKPPLKKKEDMGQKLKDEKPMPEKISSSADYFVDFLKKQGLIQDNKLVIPKKKSKTAANKKEEHDPSQLKRDLSYEDLVKQGIYYFGGIIVAPINDMVKPKEIKGLRRI
jgi:DNA polymerase III delta prime subunit